MLAFIDPESLIPATHPIRAIRQIADTALAELSPIFARMYAATGRPSIPPERLLKGGFLMALYSIRSARALCEEVTYHLLYRWFLGMDMLEPMLDHSTFSKNRERLPRHGVVEAFFAAVVRQADARALLSDEHFTVDGTLIEAAASHKSFRPTTVVAMEAAPDDPGNPTVDDRGAERSNATHASTTDPESRLAKKSAGKEAKLSYAAHALLENRNGLLVDPRVTTATGTAERDAAPELLDRARRAGLHPRTLGADKGYDTKACVAEIREHGVTPHVTQNSHRLHRSAIDGRTTRHAGYRVSQRIRKRVEEIFGWGKTIGGMRRTRFVGLAKAQMAMYLVGAAYNLVRITTLTRSRTA